MALSNTPSQEYSWQGTNLPLFGSDEDKRVKKESGLQEEAWCSVLNTHCPRLFVWRVENSVYINYFILVHLSVEESGLQEEAWCSVLNTHCPRLFVWRVEKFKIRPVNENDYGHFFNGDSYIVLNVYSKGRGLGYDVHSWVGSKSTPEEYTTAVYKTVELDAVLDNQAVQHREVEQYESCLFKSYFSCFRILNGGIDSGFRRTTPNEYQPRLLHFHQAGRGRFQVQEVDLSINSLDSTDVFILDLGSKLYQWNGSKSNKEKRYNAAQFLLQVSSERNGRCKTAVLDELFTNSGDEFLHYLPDKPVHRSKKYCESTKCIYKLSDEDGNLSFDLVVKNHLPKRAVNEDEVFLVDAGYHLFIYIGSKCLLCEKQNALSYAHCGDKIITDCFISMEEYNWKDTNMALFGSDEERSIKKEAAKTEEAWQQIRPTGKSTLLDEYVTAAYKTVELDTFLDDKAIQHREVDGLESKQFKSYFKKFRTLEGGYDSGFNHTKPNEFKTRLIHFRDIDSSHVELREVPYSRNSLVSEDVFILDLGSLAYQWIGSKSGKYERFKSAEYLLKLKSERNGRCKIQVLEENENSHELKEFLSKLPNTEITAPSKNNCGMKAVHRLSDEDGEMKLSLVCKEVLPRSVITQDDVYFIDNGSHLYVYIGDQCSTQEKRNALSNAHVRVIFTIQ
ncbi:gelsolin [Schistosoma bovis]|uniref:Gelsolin n=1 Tax=Schistosoma bovis TaxID=6184 RepID=A0A430QN79_SCHBO|nr:gelsolin [Schistosoma bovis]